MNQQYLAQAEHELISGLSVIPPTVPASWTGRAAHACDMRLSQSHADLAMLYQHMLDARASLAQLGTTVDEAGLQCLALT